MELLLCQASFLVSFKIYKIRLKISIFLINLLTYCL